MKIAVDGCEECPLPILGREELLLSGQMLAFLNRAEGLHWQT